MTFKFYKFFFGTVIFFKKDFHKKNLPIQRSKEKKTLAIIIVCRNCNNSLDTRKGDYEKAVATRHSYKYILASLYMCVWQYTPRGLRASNSCP